MEEVERAFSAACEELEEDGHDAVNPLDICARANAKSWSACMKVCLKELLRCEMVLVLPGWEKSKGCALEIIVASSCGIHVVKVKKKTKPLKHKAPDGKKNKSGEKLAKRPRAR